MPQKPKLQSMQSMELIEPQFNMNSGANQQQHHKQLIRIAQAQVDFNQDEEEKEMPPQQQIKKDIIRQMRFIPTDLARRLETIQTLSDISDRNLTNKQRIEMLEREEMEITNRYQHMFSRSILNLNECQHQHQSGNNEVSDNPLSSDLQQYQNFGGNDSGFSKQILSNQESNSAKNEFLQPNHLKAHDDFIHKQIKTTNQNNQHIRQMMSFRQDQKPQMRFQSDIEEADQQKQCMPNQFRVKQQMYRPGAQYETNKDSIANHDDQKMFQIVSSNPFYPNF